MRQLGVGLVYWPELASVFEESGTVGVLELEPQAYWEKIEGTGGFCYRANDTILAQVALLPQAKLLHGVGQPVGGAVDDPLEYGTPFRNAIELLNPVWVSEHLSFNRTNHGTTCEETGFLLPPRQSAAGANQAARNIRRFSERVARPFAFETGVNYLRPRKDEMVDGEFFGAILAQTDCGILVDLHNLWCNERNGRERVMDTLAQIPIDRVWELHLAGGMEFQGLWLDAHSDFVPPPVLEMAEQIIPQLSNLGAIIFEILPQHLPRVGIDGVHRQLDALKALWMLRAPQIVDAGHFAVDRFPYPEDGTGASASDEIAAWESSLVAALRGSKTGDSRFADLGEDPGVRVLRHLIGDARRSSIARSLRYTTTLLLLGVGAAETHALLNAYFGAYAPESFAVIEADRFAGFLLGHCELFSRVPYLSETLAFEHALIRAIAFGVTTDLEWSTEPTALFSVLDGGCAPRDLPALASSMRVGPATSS